jgi:very-short-patch-repair endonuclease
MGPKSSTAAQKIARIAFAAHGVVTREELLAAGVTSGQIKRRLESGVLLREHAGVYRVGHRAPSVEARYLAAVRACGEGAVLSGLAAAHLYKLIKGSPPRPEVTAPNDRRVPGVTTHRSKRIEATTYRGIPIATVPRVVIDLAATLSLNALARACHEAEILHGTTPAHIEAVLAHHPNARGAPNLHKILRGDVRVTLSKLERRFLELLTQAGLPLPETNREASGRRVDCRWPEHRLTVELDGYTYHHSRHAWEQDRHREREARARGDEFRRYTYDDVFHHARQTLAELHTLL